jgi:hypothetical protein
VNGPAHAVQHDLAVVLDPGRLVIGEGVIEPTGPQREQVLELVGNGKGDLVHASSLGDQIGNGMDASDVFGAGSRRCLLFARPDRQLPDGHPDDEEQRGRDGVGCAELRRLPPPWRR